MCLSVVVIMVCIISLLREREGVREMEKDLFLSTYIYLMLRLPFVFHSPGSRGDAGPRM